MCGVMVWGLGEGVTRSRFNSGYHDLGLLQVDFFSSCLCTHVKWVTILTSRQTPHTSCIADLQVESQPEDGPHIGPKHVVVFLLYY